MLNQGNIVVVWYPEHGLRTRNCQTTVYPPKYVKRPSVDAETQVKNYNKWSMYIRREVVLMAGDGNSQVDEAKRILEKQIK